MAGVSDTGLPNLSNRLTLRLPEAARVLGISERTLRRNLHELEGAVWRYGRTVLVSIEGLREIDRQRRRADAERARQDREREATRRAGRRFTGPGSVSDVPRPCIGRSSSEHGQKGPRTASDSERTSG